MKMEQLEKLNESILDGTIRETKRKHIRWKWNN